MLSGAMAASFNARHNCFALFPASIRTVPNEEEMTNAFPEDPEDPDTIVDPEDPEQPTEGESESVTEPEDTSSEPEQSTDGESDSVTEPAGSEEATAQETATTPVGSETLPAEDAGCASLVALTALSLLPLAWFALRKKED